MGKQKGDKKPTKSSTSEKKPKRPRQLEVPGTERQNIPEVMDAAEAYETARDKRMALTEEESTAKTALVEVMKKHNLTVYKDPNAVPPILVTRKPGKDSVKVERLDNKGSDS